MSRVTRQTARRIPFPPRCATSIPPSRGIIAVQHLEILPNVSPRSLVVLVKNPAAYCNSLANKPFWMECVAVFGRQTGQFFIDPEG